MNRQDVIEQRIYWMHQTIADRIKADPGLLEVARANIRRWRERSGDKPWMREWERILERGAAGVVALLQEHSDTANRLRSSTPFVGILNERERQKFYSDEFLHIIEENHPKNVRSVGMSR